MKLQLLDAISEEVLDVFEVRDGSSIYETGRARSLVESSLELHRSASETASRLNGWSNGYVLVKEFVTR